LRDVFAIGSLPLSTPVMAAGTGQWVAARMIADFRKVAPPQKVIEIPETAQPALPPPLPPPLPPTFAPPGMAGAWDGAEYADYAPHPWIRYFARNIDHALFMVPLWCVWMIVVDPNGPPPVSPLLVMMAFLVLWLIAETFMLAAFGT